MAAHPADVTARAFLAAVAFVLAILPANTLGPLAPGDGPLALGGGPLAPGDGPLAPRMGPLALADGPLALGAGPVTPGGEPPAHGAPGRQARTARYISLVPAVTEILFALGAGDSVVGVSSFDRFPPEVRTRARVGALVDPDFERILSLKPDLVFVYGTQSDLIARLERAGLSIFRYEHAGLADVTTTIQSIGDRIQRVDTARALTTRIDKDLEDVRKRVAGRVRPKTAIVFEREPGTLRGIFASAGIGFMHDLLEVAGGADVFGDIKRQSVQASVELLLARAPEVIIEVYGEAQWSPERLANELSVWASLRSIPAVRNKRVHILVDDRLAVPGPRVGEAARRLAELIHPK